MMNPGGSTKFRPINMCSLFGFSLFHLALSLKLASPSEDLGVLGSLDKVFFRNTIIISSRSNIILSPQLPTSLKFRCVITTGWCVMVNWHRNNFFVVHKIMVHVLFVIVLEGKCREHNYCNCTHLTG